MSKRSYSAIISTLAATPVGPGNPGSNDRLVADEPLTPRESEVADLVLRGFGNKVIARNLGLQVGTVKIHLHHIYQKLGVPNRMVLRAKR